MLSVNPRSNPRRIALVATRPVVAFAMSDLLSVAAFHDNRFEFDGHPGAESASTMAATMAAYNGRLIIFRGGAYCAVCQRHPALHLKPSLVLAGRTQWADAGNLTNGRADARSTNRSHCGKVGIAGSPYREIRGRKSNTSAHLFMAHKGESDCTSGLMSVAGSTTNTIKK